MRSSSTEAEPFLPRGSGAWVRLTLVVLLGSAAVVGPAIGRTGAIYTDVETVGVEVVGPTPTATPTATPSPAQPTAPASAPEPTTALRQGPGASSPAAAPTPNPRKGTGKKHP